MEIRRLSYFVRIAEDGSLTKASSILRIAQPALSRQIRLLEEELGVSLFNRTARGMALTEEGAHLRAAVAGPLRELELALQNVRAFSARIEGNFAIGMSPNVGRILAGPLAVKMSQELSRIKLRIVEGPTGSLVDWLNRGLIDLALLEDASRHERLFDRELLSQQLMLVGLATEMVEAGLDPGRPVPFAEVAQGPLIIPSHHLGIRNTINEASAKARVTPNVVSEVDSAQLALELVENGNGRAILPSLFLPRDGKAGRLMARPIADPMLPFSLYASVRRHLENGTAGRISIVGYVVDAVNGLIASAVGEASDDVEKGREIAPR